MISFAEEKEPELRWEVPQLFGSAFTKQAADHLKQVETLRKAKGKGKKFFPGLLAEAGEMAGGASHTAKQGMDNASHSRGR